MTTPIIYMAYDYYETPDPPYWSGVIRDTFPDVAVYDPAQSLLGIEGTLQESTVSIGPEALHLLGLPPALRLPWDEAKAELLEHETLAQRGHVPSILAHSHYVLIRSSLVLVDGDAAFQGSPMGDLVLASQLGIPTILVCDRTIQAPYFLAYADVSVASRKVVQLVATMLSSVIKRSNAWLPDNEDNRPEPQPNV